METYNLLREFAASWFLLIMLVIFVGIIVWVFRPGSRKMHDDTAQIPFRHDTSPDEPDSGDKGKGE